MGGKAVKAGRLAAAGQSDCTGRTLCPGRLFNDDLEGLPRRGAGVDRQRLCSQRFSVNVVRVKDDRIRRGLSPLGIDGQRPGRHCVGNRGTPAGKGVACLCRSRDGGYCRAVFVGLRCIDFFAETVFIREEIAVAGIKDLYDRRTVGLDPFLYPHRTSRHTHSAYNRH